jgi:outer membrane biosynthesis protein TonB
MTRPIDATDPILPEFPRRSPESPEIWLVQLFGALVLHAVLLFGVRVLWAEITVEEPQAGAIDFVEVGTVDQVNEAAVQPDKAEGVAPTQPAPVAQQPQTTLQQPEPEPIAQVPPQETPSPEPSGSPSPIVEQPSPTPTKTPIIKPSPTTPSTAVPTPKPTTTASPNPSPTTIAETPQTGDGKKPGDIAGAPGSELQTQGYGSIIKPNLSPISQRELNATNASLSIDPLPPQLVPKALGIDRDIAFQVNVNFALENDRLIRGSVSLGPTQSPFVKSMPQAALQQFIESILADAQFRVEIQTATGAVPAVASSWNAIVEIQVSTPGG